MTDEGYISHATPQRIRFKIPARRGDTAFFQRVEIAFRNSPLEGVVTNPETASVLLLGPRETIMRLVADRNLFKVSTDSLTLGRHFEFARMRTEMKRFVGVDATTAAFLALILVAAVQTVRGSLFMAMTALWYATDSARLHRL